MDMAFPSMVVLLIIITGSIIVLPADGDAQDRRDWFNSEYSFETNVPYYLTWSTRDYWPVSKDKKFEIDEEGNIYLRSFNERTNVNWIIVLDKHGKEVLSITEKDTSYTDPSLTPDGNMVFGSSRGRLHCYDKRGTEIWNRTISDGKAAMSRPFVSDDGKIFVLIRQGNRTFFSWHDGNGNLIGHGSTSMFVFGPDLFLNSKVGIIVVEERRVVGMDLKGSLLWTKNMSGYVTDFEHDKERVYVGTLFGDMVCIDHSGKTMWSKLGEMDLDHMKIDRNGDLLIVHTKWSQMGEGTSYLRKMTPQGEVLWTVRCPYSNSKPTLDKDNRILLGGLGDLVQFEPNGTRRYEDEKDWWVRRCDIVLLDERTMLVRDFECLRCYVAIPCSMTIRGSQPFGNDMRIDFGIEWTYEDHPRIKEIVLLRSDTQGQKEIHLSAGTRRYIEQGPSTETFEMKLILVLEDGTRIEGPSMSGFAEEQPLHYIAVGVGGGCCSVVIFGIVLTIVILSIRARKKSGLKE